MSNFFASGAAADLILAVLLVEAALLIALRRPPRLVLATILPGALIVVALRGALTGADWPWIALPLALALPAHLVDLAARRAER